MDTTKDEVIDTAIQLIEKGTYPSSAILKEAIIRQKSGKKRYNRWEGLYPLEWENWRRDFLKSLVPSEEQASYHNYLRKRITRKESILDSLYERGVEDGFHTSPARYPDNEMYMLGYEDGRGELDLWFAGLLDNNEPAAV